MLVCDHFITRKVILLLSLDYVQLLYARFLLVFAAFIVMIIKF